MTTRKQASIERRNQILDAALKVFATKGFRETTNRDIATAAGINSPGLIYHYFKDQEDLFQAVLQERAPILQLSKIDPATLLAEPPREVLTLIARTFIETVSDPTTRQLIRLIMGEGLRQTEVAQMVYEFGSSHMLAFLYQYFEALMDRGEIRRADLGATVRTFIGPLFAYLFTALLWEFPDARTPTAETQIATVVDVFLEGMKPR